MTEYTDPAADVPTGVDFLNEEHVHQWVITSEEKPWRRPMRSRFVELLARLPAGSRVLELGAGPGFLAECVLGSCPNITDYTLLDYSAPMLTLSRERLARFPRAQFIQADFKRADWTRDLSPPYAAVIAMQAVHEIRHKRHVPGLYRAVFHLVAPGGSLLVCDGVPNDASLRATSLHMTAEEQLAAFAGAGFTDEALNLAIPPVALVTGRAPE
jgi:ubiquinone/menaquinone biosynthesis C-methylase UbiE